METLILIPPSEGKAEGGQGKPLRTLHPITAELLEEAATRDPYKLYKSRTEDAIEYNASVRTSPTMPAIKRYTGVVYDAIDYDTLNEKQFFDEHVRIISGLFGLLAPQDPLPNYKFPIRLLSAARKWHDAITEQVQGAFIIDLLANAHRKAISYENGIQVEFTRMRKGKVVKAGHAGKTIKGKFIRWLAEKKVTSPDDFSRFREDGYEWNGERFHKS